MLFCVAYLSGNFQHGDCPKIIVLIFDWVNTLLPKNFPGSIFTAFYIIKPWRHTWKDKKDKVPRVHFSQFEDAAAVKIYLLPPFLRFHFCV